MLLAIDIGNTNIVARRVRRRDARPELAAANAARADRPTNSACWSTGCSRTAQIERVADQRSRFSASVVPPLTGTIRAMVQRYFGVDDADGRSRRRTPACRSSTRTPPKWAPIGSSMRSRRTKSTARRARPAADRRRLRHGDDARCGDARKGEYLGGAICPGRARFPPTRCFSARRGCRGSTSANRRGRSAARRWGRSSRGCSGATSAWSKGWCGA